MLVCWPIMVVVMTGSDEMMSPFKLQVMDIGMSPVTTTQDSWAYCPWLTASSPKEKGTILGSSAIKYFQWPSIIYPLLKAQLNMRMSQQGSLLYRCIDHCAGSQQMQLLANLFVARSLLLSWQDRMIWCLLLNSRWLSLDCLLSLQHTSVVRILPG